MKARYSKTQIKAALYYQLEPGAKTALAEIFAVMRIPAREIEPGQEQELISALLQACTRQSGQGADLTREKAAAGSDSLPGQSREPCLILSGIAGEDLDVFLAALRGKGIDIPLKAVATPHNIGWSFAALYQELGRERDAFAAEKAAADGQKG